MKKLTYALILGFFVAIIAGIYSDSVQADLSDNLVRLHVIANSDTSEDQSIKYQVRDRITQEMAKTLSSAQTLSDGERIARENLDAIEAIANQELEKLGAPYRAKAVYGTFSFPTKVYDSITLPPGDYHAVRIILGEGAGQNWWCVLFPPLCFTDNAMGNMPDAQQELLTASLDRETYDVITNYNPDHMDVEVKFKIVELFQTLKQQKK